MKDTHAGQVFLQTTSFLLRIPHKPQKVLDPHQPQFTVPWWWNTYNFQLCKLVQIRKALSTFQTVFCHNNRSVSHLTDSPHLTWAGGTTHHVRKFNRSCTGNLKKHQQKSFLSLTRGFRSCFRSRRFYATESRIWPWQAFKVVDCRLQHTRRCCTPLLRSLRTCWRRPVEKLERARWAKTREREREFAICWTRENGTVGFSEGVGVNEVLTSFGIISHIWCLLQTVKFNLNFGSFSCRPISYRPVRKIFFVGWCYLYFSIATRSVNNQSIKDFFKFMVSLTSTQCFYFFLFIWLKYLILESKIFLNSSLNKFKLFFGQIYSQFLKLIQT